jgi:two-component system chemotaxis sensor kinase CheA
VAHNPLPTFLQEAEELIADIEQSALTLCSEDAPAETVHRLFRAFHTIKGSSAMCGLDAVAGFTHHVENLLDKVRDGAVPVSAPLTELVLHATDHIKTLLNAAEIGATAPLASSQTLIGTIADFAGKERCPAKRTTFRPHSR